MGGKRKMENKLKKCEFKQSFLFYFYPRQERSCFAYFQSFFHLLYSVIFLNLYLLYNSNFWIHPFSCNLISINIRLFMFSNFFSLNFISKEMCNYSALKVFLRCFSLKLVYCQIVPYLIIPVPYCYAFTLLTVGYLSFQFPSLSFPCILNFISCLSSRLHFCISAFCPISWCFWIYFGGLF